MPCMESPPQNVVATSPSEGGGTTTAILAACARAVIGLDMPQVGLRERNVVGGEGRAELQLVLTVMAGCRKGEAVLSGVVDVTSAR